METPTPKTGDTVWVRMGTGTNEEPASVLELDAIMDKEDRGEEKKKDEKQDRGTFVRFFNGVEEVVSSDRCRYLGKIEGNTNSGGKGSSCSLRRSTRRLSQPVSSEGQEEGDNTAFEDCVGVKIKKDADEVKDNKEAGAMVMDLQANHEVEKEGTSSDDDGMKLSDFKSKRPRAKPKQNPKTGGKKNPKKRKAVVPVAKESDTDIHITAKKKKSSSSKKDLKLKEGQVEMSEPSSPHFENKKKAKKSAHSKKVTRKIDIMTEETVSKKKRRGKKAAAAAKGDGRAKGEVSCIVIPQASESPSTCASALASRAGRPDGNGGLNQGSTFVVEYAKTSRSTCKKCDVRIEKNEMRVGHRPLFRGKPGYQVFKHLQCAVFTEEIACAEDVAGYECLRDEDYYALAKRVNESFTEIQKEKEELDADELVQKRFEGALRPRPKGLVANLLPFQVEGLSWMYNQEKNEKDVRGGILADEMGMGKTLQTIATILDNRPRLQRCMPGGKYPPCTDDERKEIDAEEVLWEQALEDWKHEMTMNDVHDSLLPRGRKNGQADGGARAGTLVVCPVIALSQWKGEIEKFCEREALSICTYHGPDRVKTVPRELLIKYDVVLTTYQVLEADFRKMVSPNKVKCPNCGQRFKVDKLRVHLKYFCGEGAQRTEAQARTIRNSERGNLPARQGQNGSGRRGRRNGNSPSQKKNAGKNKIMEGNKKLKVKSTDTYASESDLSVNEEVIRAHRGKSARGAAAKARARLQQTKSASRNANTDDDDDFSLDSEDGTSSSDDENVALKRAKVKQAQAMRPAKWSKKTFNGINKKRDQTGKKSLKEMMDKREQTKKGKKSFKEKRKGPKNRRKTAKKSKKGDGDDSSDDSSSSDDESVNPEDNIDMDALIAEAMAGAQMSNLHSICWWRVVLDEAHFIKSRSSQTSHAAFALTGIHRWCLSGTPLQNRVGEFYSLIRFLRLDPMAHYMCRAKGCDCKQIHYRMMHGRCKDCGHGSVQHYSYFNKHILNPIQRDGYFLDGRRAMFVLKNEVLDKCLLRRTKETRAEDMNLPPRIVTVKAVRLHPVEEDFYNALYTQTTSSFNDYVEGGTLLNNYAHIFDLLMRMRQSVAHPYLVVHSKKGVNQAGSAPAISNGRTDCHLCNEPPTERVVSTCCQTAFCKGCVLEYMEMAVDTNNGTPCPHCNAPFSIDLNDIQDEPVDDSTLTVDPKTAISTVGLPSLKELPHVASGSILRRIDLAKFATSTKIEALTQELIEMRKTSPGSKAIVFSQFVNMLDLIRWRLHSDPFLSDIGLGAKALHGGMDVKARDSALQDFREDPNTRVLLMSLKAGGVALNLTVANYIYLMDPWWNPAAELQAIDRTHRLGQYRPIRAVRFIAENTVEERILQLQEKKRLVFDGTVGRDAGSLKMLTVDDMKSLFA